MKTYVLIGLFISGFAFSRALQAQMNGAGDLSHPTVDELHQKLNELVSRFRADEEQRRKNAAAAKTQGDKKEEPPSDEFRILLERGGKRTALDRDNPVVLEEIILKMAGNNIAAIELRYEEAAMRRQFSHKRSIKNDDVRKTTYGHIVLYYHAQGDLPKSEVLVNMSTTDRAKLLAIYIDGLLRAIRELDDRVLAAKRFASRKMNSALNMGIRIK
ncbi:MAG: hypothetical protein NZL89_05390 [Leptospiraceae bacterium]|nr:hypothetical protein [Leptospiraceae bacterium]